MNAKYYRFLYHPVAQGVCFTASIGAEKGKDGIQMMYLSAGDSIEGEEELPVSAMSEKLSLLILGDCMPLTIKRAEQLCRSAVAETILAPCKEECGCLSEKLRDRTTYLKAGQTMEIEKAGFVVKIFAAGSGEDGRLIAYFGSSGVTPKGEECVMNVKSCTPDMPCHMTVDASNLNCEMRCMLGRDITQCKRHNQKSETYFADGHLLPGAAQMSACLPKIREYLAEEWKRIRFISLPENMKKIDRELLDIGTSGNRRFYIGSADTDEQVIKEAVCSDSFGTFIAVGKGSGLCISGCYAKR